MKRMPMFRSPLGNLRRARHSLIQALDQMVPGLIAYLSRDAIDGWLQHQRAKDGMLLPWLVRRMRYVEPEQGMPYVVVDMLANTMQSASWSAPTSRIRLSGMTKRRSWSRHDIVSLRSRNCWRSTGFTEGSAR